MGYINKRVWYLVWAVIAFLLAPVGFAGNLEWKGLLRQMNPTFAGATCLAIGGVMILQRNSQREFRGGEGRWQSFW